MNLHDVPERVKPEIPEDYFTPEMLEELYRYYEPQVQRLRHTYYAPPTWHANNARIEVRAANGTLGVDEPTFRYRLAGDTTWRLPDRVEGVFLDEQT